MSDESWDLSQDHVNGDRAWSDDVIFIKSIRRERPDAESPVKTEPVTPSGPEDPSEVASPLAALGFTGSSINAAISAPELDAVTLHSLRQAAELSSQAAINMDRRSEPPAENQISSSTPGDPTSARPRKKRQTQAQKERQLAESAGLFGPCQSLPGLSSAPAPAQGLSERPTDAIEDPSEGHAYENDTGPVHSETPSSHATEHDEEDESSSHAAYKQDFNKKMELGILTISDRLALVSREENEQQRVRDREREMAAERAEDDEQLLSSNDAGNLTDTESLFIHEDRELVTRNNREPTIRDAGEATEGFMRERRKKQPVKRPRKRDSGNGRSLNSSTAGSSTRKRAKYGHKEYPRIAASHNPRGFAWNGMWNHRSTPGQSHDSQEDPSNQEARSTGAGGNTLRERKKQALVKDLKTIPERSCARGDQDDADISEAQANFDHTPSSNGTQSFALDGMKSSLMRHQLVAVSDMRKMEKADDCVKGGILADVMGLGKTVMVLANMVDGRKEHLGPDEIKATLIVVPAPLMIQWRDAIKQHVSANIFDVMEYRSGKLEAMCNPMVLLQNHDIVLTTYDEVSRSFPKRLKEHELEDQGLNYYNDHCGPLHQVKWHRVVCDECSMIKNLSAHRTWAAGALEARHRWLLSGTIATNSVTEFHSFFSFLRVPVTGSQGAFKANFLADEEARERLHQYLRKVMIRRTYEDKILGVSIRTILGLPRTRKYIIEVKFSRTERLLYDIVEKRCAGDIAWLVRNQLVHKLNMHVFVRLLLLRMVSAHFFSAAHLLVKLLNKEDFDEIKAIISRAEAEQDLPSDQLTKLREFVSSLGRENEEQPRAGTRDLGGLTGRNAVDPSRYLEHIWTKTIENIEEPADICIRCKERLIAARELSPCGHHICAGCLQVHRGHAASFGWDVTTCPSEGCLSEITGDMPCDPDATRKKSEAEKRKMAKEARAQLQKWLEENNEMFASAKMLGVKSAILGFKEEEPDVKIIVYTQFLSVIILLRKMCADEGWNCTEYHGQLSQTKRDANLKFFQLGRGCNILLASFFAGGVGLNIQQASRVILVDLWWNSAMEQQAFSRVYRIGQKKRTFLVRFVVKDSIDERILKMQTRKDKEISEVVDGMPGCNTNLGIQDILELFGVYDGPAEGGGFSLPEQGIGMIMHPEEY